MSFESHYQQLLAYSEKEVNAANDEWLSEAERAVVETFFFLKEKSLQTKLLLSASKSSTIQQPKGAASKTVAATLAETLGAKYSSSKQSCKLSVSQNNSVEPASESEAHEPRVPHFLPVLARIISLRPDLVVLHEFFAKTVLLHFCDPIMFPILCGDFKSGDQNPCDDPIHESTYMMPKWWPQLQEFSNFHQSKLFNPIHDGFDLLAVTKYQVNHVTNLLVKILNASQLLISKVASSTASALNIILQHMLDNDASKDVVTLIISHSKESVEKIYSLSILGLSETIKKQAALIIELIITRQTVVATYGGIINLAGAQRFMGLYSQKQRAAYELVAKNPFKFILDLLDHSNICNEPSKPILLPCIGIASQKIAALSEAKDQNPLYESFNRASKVRSLYAILTSFGVEIVKFALQVRRAHQALDVLDLILKNFQNSLPPLAKPNYFFVDRTPPNVSDGVKAAEITYDLADLNISVRLILISIESVIESEMKEILGVSADHALSEKILSRNFQYVLLLFLAVLISHPESDVYGSNREACKVAIASISRKIFSSCQAQESNLYVTLFNFANDVCHLHTEAIPFMLDLIKIIVTANETNTFKELVASALELFSFTFGCSFDDITQTSNGTVTVPQAEYSSLYYKNRYK